MHISDAIARIVAVNCVAGFFWVSDPSWADTGWDSASNRLQPCPYERNCVSSNYLEPPNRYVSPLKLVNDRDKAFQRAVRDLNSIADGVNIAEVKPDKYYIHLTVPGTAPSSLDDIELLFAEEGIVNIRCDARVTLPIPPFCLKKNCINGNMDQRSRVESLALQLGLPPSDQQQMQKAKWTPIFFNADRVPDFDDNDDNY
jgi:uncharacterized protein (DUF1499 family)